MLIFIIRTCRKIGISVEDICTAIVPKFGEDDLVDRITWIFRDCLPEMTWLTSYNELFKNPERGLSFMKEYPHTIVVLQEPAFQEISSDSVLTTINKFNKMCKEVCFIQLQGFEKGDTIQ